MKQILQKLALVAAVCGSALSMQGQSTNSGDIRGTAIDDSGALIPDVAVTVKNLATGVVKQLTTNKDGLYDTSSIVVGTYSVKFEKQGFQSFERTGITLQVGISTVNAKLQIGSVAQEVVVTSDIPLLTTESGEQSTTFEAKSMAQLPNVGGGTGPDWQNFTILIPGSSGAPGSNGGTNPGQEVSVNGNLPYSNVLADGVSTTLSHSANADVNTFETIAELQVNTSAMSAQYGIGGVVFNQITKGGTNKFHGSLYEYFQTDKFNAFPSSFGAATNSLTKGRLHYNNFGGSIGGPVLVPKIFNGRDRAFFFFNYDQIVNHGGAGGNAVNDVPTAAVMGGDFSNQSTLYDPTTQTIGVDAKGNPYPIRKAFLQEYGSNAIPQQLIDKAAAEFQKLYPTQSNHIPNGTFQPGTVNARGVLQKNFVGNTPGTSTPYKRYFGRFDYNISSKNRLTMTDQQRDTPVFYPSNFTACPVSCQFGDVDSNTAQITDVHTFTSHTINEFRFGYTFQGNFFADQALGSGAGLVPDFGFSKASTFPTVRFTGNYPYAWISPSANAVYKEHVFDPSDVVTLIKGKHVLHFGGEYLMYEDNSTAWGNQNAGTLDFNGYYTRQWIPDPKNPGAYMPDGSTGQDYADFLLGYSSSWSAAVSPEYAGRLKSPQVFVQDDYKVLPNLTVNLGLRYQIRQGWTERHGNEATFDPTVVNPATKSLGAFWYGTTKANGRDQLQANTYTTVLPRVGFSWLPKPDMTIRGGFGVYAYNLSLDTYGGGMGAAISSSGSLSDQQNGLYPIVKFGSNGTAYPLGGGTQAPVPYTAASTDPARFNGQNVSANPYHTPDPKIYQYNLAMQNALGSNMVFELAYVGSHAINLLNGATDLNAAPLNHLSSNNTQFRPYGSTFGNISSSSNDGISNYNSLQVTLQRRLSKGLSFDVNYTWAHFLDTFDSSSWGSRSGAANYQYVNNAGLNYGNSNFDIRNAFKGRVVYQLPFGHGRMFMNHSRILDAVLGGYQISSTMLFQGGNPFTVVAAGSDSYQHAGSQFANLVKSNPYAAHRNYLTWIDPTAFTAPGSGGFGNTRRNQFYGPGNELVNLSAGKTFSITEGTRLELRVDATNAFNHVNLGDPGGGTLTLTGASNTAGTPFTAGSSTRDISGSSNGPRAVQLAGRFTF